MSFAVNKLTGKKWAADATAVPEGIVKNANDPNALMLWATRIPALQISQLTTGSGPRATDPQTGNFLPAEVMEKWGFEFGRPQAETGLVLTDITVDYHEPVSPVRPHNSNEGIYAVAIVLESDRRTGRPPFSHSYAYTLEMYFNAGPGGRPWRLIGEGKVQSVFPQGRRTYLCKFRLTGSFYPKRNQHLLPKPPPQPTPPQAPILYGDEEWDGERTFVTVRPDTIAPTRFVVGKRNLGIPKR